MKLKIKKFNRSKNSQQAIAIMNKVLELQKQEKHEEACFLYKEAFKLMRPEQ